MLVAQKSHVVDMKNKEALLEIIRMEKPDYILPEIEALSIEALFEAQHEGFNVIPNAEAVNKTMHRKNIRVFAAQELGLKTSKYRFVKSLDELKNAVKELGIPCVVKPVMSSSGHGQSIIKDESEIVKAWEFALEDARGSADELIVEEFINFDYEITLLTARNDNETVFCPPIGHIQKDGDYIFSWQPMQMSEVALAKSQEIAKAITDGLGGRGIFGVELFIAGDEVYFSEVSPRPHDTGMVTMISQTQSEFALHIRAVLNLPLGFEFIKEAASAALKSKVDSYNPIFEVPDEVFSNDSRFVVFGKPESHKDRRMGVLLVSGDNSLQRAKDMITQIHVK
jgi:phosphoribosylglycinamide formyltransferase 2